MRHVDEALGPEVAVRRRDQRAHARGARRGVEDGIDAGDARREACGPGSEGAVMVSVCPGRTSPSSYS